MMCLVCLDVPCGTSWGFTFWKANFLLEVANDDSLEYVL